jgi:Flp pilus assembly protein TadD
MMPIMMRNRATIIALIVIVGLPLAWLLVRGSWGRRAAPVPHRMSTTGGTGQETPSQTGLRLLQAGKPGEALPALRRASQLEPDNPLVLNNLSVAEIQVGAFAAAIRDCEHAIRLAPDFRLARNNLAWAQAERQKLVASLQTREANVEGPKGARKAPEWIDLGMGWYRAGEWDRSQRCFEQALRLEPKNAIAVNDLGAVWMEKRRPDLALDLFRQVLTADPTNQLARNNLAWAQAELEKIRLPSSAAR